MHILITILVTITLSEMMFAMGLRLRFPGLKEAVNRSRWLLLWAIISNYAIIPAVTLLIIVVFHLPPLVAAGLLILGVSPAAPYALPFTVVARGNLALSTALMVILASISAVMAPLLLHFLFPVITSGDLSLKFDPIKMIGTLFVIQLFPLCIGIAIGQWRPELSSKLILPFSRISKILNTLMIAVIAILQFKVIVAIKPDEMLPMMVLIVSGILTGWVFGWPGRENRISSSIITSMRNMGLAMGIAATSFPGSPVITTILAYSVVSGISVLAFALMLRWGHSS